MKRRVLNVVLYVSFLVLLFVVVSYAAKRLSSGTNEGQGQQKEASRMSGVDGTEETLRRFGYDDFAVRLG